MSKAPKCPICGKPREHAYRPFCSKRCADIDLGKWAGGDYAIPGEDAAPIAGEDVDAEIEAGGADAINGRTLH